MHLQIARREHSFHYILEDMLLNGGEMNKLGLAVISVMFASKSSQFEPGNGRSRNDKTNSTTPSTNL